MKKLSYFIAVLFASSMLLFACNGQQGQGDQGRGPGDDTYIEDDRGMYQDDQDGQIQEEQDQDLYEQNTVGTPGTEGTLTPDGQQDTY